MLQYAINPCCGRKGVYASYYPGSGAMQHRAIAGLGFSLPSFDELTTFNPPPPPPTGPAPSWAPAIPPAPTPGVSTGAPPVDSTMAMGWSSSEVEAAKQGMQNKAEKLTEGDTFLRDFLADMTNLGAQTTADIIKMRETYKVQKASEGVPEQYAVQRFDQAAALAGHMRQAGMTFGGGMGMGVGLLALGGAALALFVILATR